MAAVLTSGWDCGNVRSLARSVDEIDQVDPCVQNVKGSEWVQRDMCLAH